MRAARGFNLVEAMIATSVLAIGLLGAIPLVVRSIEQGARSRRQTAAEHLAAELLERLRTELRYDATAKSEGSASLRGGWKADVLPHRVRGLGAGAAACVDGVCCQPAGEDDGVVWHYGPIAYSREGQPFYACYALRRAPANDKHGRARIGVPAGSSETLVKILWREGGAWRWWTVAELQLPGE